MNIVNIVKLTSKNIKILLGYAKYSPLGALESRCPGGKIYRGDFPGEYSVRITGGRETLHCRDTVEKLVPK